MKHVYVVQTNAERLEKYKDNQIWNELSERELVVLNFGEKELLFGNAPILHRDCTWSEGRNKLYDFVNQTMHYDFIHMLDDDLNLQKGCLKDYEKSVEEQFSNGCLIFYPLYNRKLSEGFPVRYGFGLDRNDIAKFDDPMFEKIMSQSFTRDVDVPDQCFITLHNSVTETILPYDSNFDYKNWWFSAIVAFEIVRRYYRSEAVVIPAIITENIENSEYPQVNQNKLGVLEMNYLDLIGKENHVYWKKHKFPK